MNKFCKIVLALLYFLIWSQPILSIDLPEKESFIPQISNPVISPSGKDIIFSGEDYHGLYLLSLKTNKFMTIVNNVGAGYRANWSPDGSRIGFKLIHGENAQQPVYYDMHRQEIIPLYAVSSTAGVPAFSENGLVSFTVGYNLFIMNKDLQPVHQIDIGSYANLAPISPDGKMAIYNDIKDQLWILKFETGVKIQITSGTQGYFNPIWSPDSKMIVASSLPGYLYTFEIETGHSYQLGRGSSASWMEDSKGLIYCEEMWKERYQLVSSRPALCRYDGSAKKFLNLLKETPIRFLNYTTKSQKLAYMSTNDLVIGKLNRYQRRIQLKTEKILMLDELNDLIKPSKPLRNDTPKFNYQMEIQTFEAPYLHQVYDTPNWFNGHWACGATSAIMALAYYDVLPAWLCNCSWPYSHTSKYGRYVCEIYNYNGYTYNIGGYDPNGNFGYGGYGFIIQNNWANTKEYMAKYARQHKISSSVDWNPSYAKFSLEIDQQFPVVILNSLTSAGHYILAIGYNSSQRNVIINDPYGDKNQGYMNYNGKNVVYDWPGYNSGNANLNIVHCLIYMRLAPDLVPSTFSLPDTLTVGQEIPITFNIFNQGWAANDSSEVSLYLSSNRYFNKSDILLNQISLPSIPAEDSLVINTIVQLPDSLPSSKWAIGAMVDENDSLKEVFESNNLFYDVFVLKGYPLIYGFYPSPDATISTFRPQIRARFKDDYFGIISDSIKFYLDEIDVTAESLIESNEITFTPENDLSASTHRLRIEVTNKPGYTAKHEWEFHIHVSAVSKENEIIKPIWTLSQNFPNPFNTMTQFQYQVAEQNWVKIQIFSMEGKLIKTLVNEYRMPGVYRCTWDGKNQHERLVASGVYFYRMTGGAFYETHRMIYLK